ncbi:MAG: UDP-N-acetylmuramate--L-alanine ligase [Candidatus Gastranaerophilaceae bacterium]|jgi:UDP-N-acetylmuramate--alanine ligase
MEIIDNKKFILEKTKNGTKHIHFLGLGGIGMSGLAKFALNLGFRVSGSDIKDSPQLLSITELGGIVFIGHEAGNVGNAGLLVVSTAINEDNPEIVEAGKRNIPIIHRSQLLEALMSGLGLDESEKQITIGVSGTHGKTSTTGMIGLIFEHAKLNPSIVVGGKLPELMTNAKFGCGKHFIAELDESDGSIAIYKPEYTVITNIEKDHVDHYEDGLNQLIDTFKGYISRLHPDSKVVICADDEGNKRLLKEIDHKNVILYSVNHESELFNSAKYTVKNLSMVGFSSSADVYKDNELLGTLKLRVPGMHNISNALASVVIAIECGLSFESATSSLEKFTGMKRRFQLFDTVKEIQIVDDYAHHPTEIRATLKSARNIVNAGLANRVVSIFQPHRYSRLAGLWDEFKNCFSDTDVLYITDVYSAGEKPVAGFTAQKLCEDIMKKPCIYAGGSLENIAEKTAPDLKAGDIVLTIGAGTITKLGNLLIEKLS